MERAYYYFASLNGFPGKQLNYYSVAYRHNAF